MDSITVNKKFLSQYYTTCAKGIAMLMVVLSHIANSWGVRWFTPLGGTGVAIFLILSGYGLCVSHERNGLKEFWKKRFVGAYLPYLLMNIITIILMGVENVSPWRIILSLLLIKPISVYWWFMQYLFICYFIFWTVNKLSISEKVKERTFLIIGLLLFVLFERGLWAEQSLSFFFGIYIAKNNMGKKKFHIGIAAIVLGILALAIKHLPIIRNNQDIVYLWNFVQLINKFCLAVGIVCLTSLIVEFGASRLLYYVGIVSFEIYLIHSYTISFIKEQTVMEYVIFILSTIIGTVLLYFTDRYLSDKLLKKV